MTNEEAIDWIVLLIETMRKETSGNYPDPEYKFEVYQALKMSIEALKAEPCDEQSVYTRAYREGYDKGYSDGDFYARHEDEIRESYEDCE